MCYSLAKFQLRFYGSATFRNGDKKKRKETPSPPAFCPSHTVTHSDPRKGSTPQRQRLTQIFALQFTGETKTSGNSDF